MSFNSYFSLFFLILKTSSNLNFIPQLRQVPRVFSKGTAGPQTSINYFSKIFNLFLFLKNIQSMLARVSKMSLMRPSRSSSTQKDPVTRGAAVFVESSKVFSVHLCNSRWCSKLAGNFSRKSFLIISALHASRKCQNCCSFPLQYQIFPKYSEYSHVSNTVRFRSMGKFHLGNSVKLKLGWEI